MGQRGKQQCGARPGKGAKRKANAKPEIMADLQLIQSSTLMLKVEKLKLKLQLMLKLKLQSADEAAPEAGLVWGTFTFS